jgi:hypothetical protein
LECDFLFDFPRGVNDKLLKLFIQKVTASSGQDYQASFLKNEIGATNLRVVD